MRVEECCKTLSVDQDRTNFTILSSVPSSTRRNSTSSINERINFRPQPRRLASLFPFPPFPFGFYRERGAIAAQEVCGDEAAARDSDDQLAGLNAEAVIDPAVGTEAVRGSVNASLDQCRLDLID